MFNKQLIFLYKIAFCIDFFLNIEIQLKKSEEEYC